MPLNNQTVNQQEKVQVKPKKKKFLLLGLIFLVVMAGSLTGGYFYFQKTNGEAGEIGKTKKVETETLSTGEIIVNLSGGGSHYLRINIVLEHPKDKKLSEELSKKEHQVSDILITTLRSKTVADVVPPSSVEALKESLLKSINSQLEQGEITKIYFTDFLVQ